ncbi:hypothetical protein [Dactylosporangium sp. NPDC051484]|uniref:hypothetical protein n=1 Tax=Dactylosporangium sp. NPDC051484 TaxID=3154942 RepID=UPI00344D2CEF
MLSDEQFGERLGARLRAEVADVEPEPGRPAALRRRHARHVATVRAAVIVPTLAAVVATGLITVGGMGRDAAPATVGPTKTVDLHDVAYVTAHVTAALDNLSGYIERTTTVVPGGVTEVMQIDRATGQFRFDSSTKDGPRLSGSSTSTNPTMVTVIDYEHHAWSTYRLEVPSDAKTMAQVTGVFEDRVNIRTAISGGQLEVLGTEVVDGHQTLRLRVTPAAKVTTGTMDLLVDSESYLPVRLSVDKAGHRNTLDYAWLARTPENLATLAVTPPAGFTHKPIDGPSSGPTSGAVG